MASATPLPGRFGLQLADIDVAQLGNQALREILDLLYTNRFVVLKTGGLDNEQLVEFARRIGDPIEFNLTDKHPEILSLTNVGIDTKTDRTGAAHWHTDQSFKREMASITMLYSVQAPDSEVPPIFATWLRRTMHCQAPCRNRSRV